jgi:hypothetical protein
MTAYNIAEICRLAVTGGRLKMVGNFTGVTVCSKRLIETHRKSASGPGAAEVTK